MCVSNPGKGNPFKRINESFLNTLGQRGDPDAPPAPDLPPSQDLDAQMKQAIRNQRRLLSGNGFFSTIHTSAQGVTSIPGLFRPILQGSAVLLLVGVLGGCQSARQVQSTVDAAAGVNAALQFSMDPNAQVVLKGAMVHLQANVEGEDLPAPRMTPEAIVANPAAYTKQADDDLAAAKVPTFWAQAWGFLTGAGGVVTATLASLVLARFLPGPIGSMIANVAWEILAPKKDKVAETRRDNLAAAAGPIAEAARDLDQLRRENQDLRAEAVRLMALERETSALEPRV